MAEDIVQRVSVVLDLQNQLAAGSAGAKAELDAIGDKVAKSNATARENAARDREREVTAVGQLRTRIAELQAARTTADVAARAGIDEEVAAVERSIAAHEAEVHALDLKRIKLEETARLAVSSSDAERAAIRAQTDQQIAATTSLYELGKAGRVGVATTAGVVSGEGEAAAVEAVTRERANEAAIVERLTAQIGDLQARRATADRGAVEGIDNEIAATRRLVEGHVDEIAKLDQKRVRLTETAAVARATSEQERAEIRAATDARLVEIRTLQDQQRAAASAAAKAAEPGDGGGQGLGGLAAMLQVDPTGLLYRLMGGLSELVHKVEDSVAAAREADEAQSRLQVSLGGSRAAYEEVAAAAAEASDRTRYTADELNVVAERLATRGVPTDQLPKALRATADAAAAMHRPLADVADDIARTFAGDLPKGLKRAVPALQDTTEETRKLGAAVDVLEQRFGGRALADALTPTGREAVAVKDLGEAWKELGKAILPIVQDYMPKLRELGALVVSATTQAVQNRRAVTYDALGAIADLLPGETAAAYARGAHGVASDANVEQAKAEDAARLASDSAAARQQIQQIQQERAEARTAESANELAETAKVVIEEVRLRKAGVEQVARAVDERRDAELNALRQRRATLDDELTHSTTVEADNKDLSNAAAARGDANGQREADVARAGAMAKVRDITAEIKSLDEQAAKINRTADDDRTKSINELATQATADVAKAEQHLADVRAASERDWSAGLITQGQQQDQVTTAVDKYADAIRVARTELGKLIATETDAGSRARLATIQRSITATAEKQGIDPDHPTGREQFGRADTQIEPGRFRSAAGADLAGGEELQASALSGVADGLLAVETRAKSAKAALLDFATGFAKSMLQVVNQRLAEGAVSALSGGAKGGGIFGLFGAAAAGDPAGGVAKVAGTGATAATTGTVAATGTTAAGTSAAGGGVLGGAVASVGKAVAGFASMLAGAVVSVVTAVGGVTAAVVAGTAATIAGLAAQTAAIVAGFAQQAIATAIGAVGGLAGLIGFSEGGRVPGGSGGPNVDSVPALLVPDEHVITRDGARSVGHDVLHGINAGRVGVYRGGDAASAAAARVVTAAAGQARVSPATMSMILAGIDRGQASATARVASATTAAATARGGLGGEANLSRHTAATVALATAADKFADAAGRPLNALVDYGDMRTGIDKHLTAQGYRKFREYRAATGA